MKRRYRAGGQRPAAKTDAALRCLGLGPRNLKQIALGVYGSDEPVYRRKATYLLQTLGDCVEPVAHLPKGSGVWRLAYARSERAEAAE